MLMLSQRLGSPNITIGPQNLQGQSWQQVASQQVVQSVQQGDGYRLSALQADEVGRTLCDGVTNGCASRPDAVGKTVSDAPAGGAGSTTGSRIGGAAFDGAAFGGAAFAGVRGGAAGEAAAAAPTATQPATGVPLLALASAALWAMILRYMKHKPT